MKKHKLNLRKKRDNAWKHGVRMFAVRLGMIYSELSKEDKTYIRHCILINKFNKSL